MLERVRVAPLSLAAYEAMAGEDAVAEVRALAERLRGAGVLHVNATKYGGGVAEILPTLNALMRDAGFATGGGSSPGTRLSSTSRRSTTGCGAWTFR